MPRAGVATARGWKRNRIGTLRLVSWFGTSVTQTAIARAGQIWPKACVPLHDLVR
ncbi:hypothetical protein [Streptomyces sp. NPDC055287]